MNLKFAVVQARQKEAMHNADAHKQRLARDIKRKVALRLQRQVRKIKEQQLSQQAIQQEPISAAEPSAASSASSQMLALADQICCTGWYFHMSSFGFTEILS